MSDQPKPPAIPLQAFLAGAARALPAATGATASFRARLDSAGSGTVILCDCSQSMSESAGSRTKSALLREALESIAGERPDARIVAFGSTAREVATASELPGPAGGTALHLALGLAATHKPARTVVVSDGLPDSEELALAAAGRLGGTIDVIFCGPDSDTGALDFLRRLARLGAGRVVVRDVVREARPSLVGPLRKALSLPVPEGS